MRIKLMVGLGVVALASLAAGCSDSGTTSGTNANTTTVATTTNTTTTAQTRSAPGDSEITTTTDQTGSTVETRTFKNNTRVSKVVVTTTREGKRTARVYPVTGEPRDLPEDRVARALDDTGEAIADAAGFVAERRRRPPPRPGKGQQPSAIKRRRLPRPWARRPPRARGLPVKGLLKAHALSAKRPPPEPRPPDRKQFRVRRKQARPSKTPSRPKLSQSSSET